MTTASAIERPEISPHQMWLACPECGKERPVYRSRAAMPGYSGECGSCAARKKYKADRKHWVVEAPREQDERDLEILRLSEANVPVRKIAQKFKMTRGQVSGIIYRVLRA